jgi:hypothetical protein
LTPRVDDERFGRISGRGGEGREDEVLAEVGPGVRRYSLESDDAETNGPAAEIGNFFSVSPNRRKNKLECLSAQPSLIFAS